MHSRAELHRTTIVFRYRVPTLRYSISMLGYIYSRVTAGFPDGAIDWHCVLSTDRRGDLRTAPLNNERYWFAALDLPQTEEIFEACCVRSYVNEEIFEVISARSSRLSSESHKSP